MYNTIANNSTSELIEKKSKFIANIYYVATKEQAENKIKEVKKAYHDARHNCSAYIVLEDETIIKKSSDDGEPSGTAGAPILNILEKNNLCNILVIVTRYFGGILLGTGGLVKAYSNATLQALEKTKKTEIFLGYKFEIELNYTEFETFKFYCKKNDINIIKTEYSNNIICHIQVKKETTDIFLDDIKNRKINIIRYEQSSKLQGFVIKIS